LLDFKWRGFAQRKYFFELSAYLFHILCILVWNALSGELLINEQ
jgi:hypothetical protein